MDLTLSPSEQQFRDEVREWIEANHPGPEPEAGLEEVMAFRREWQQKMHEAGWAGISWPKEYGGRGATMIEQAIFVGEVGLNWFHSLPGDVKFNGPAVLIELGFISFDKDRDTMLNPQVREDVAVAIAKVLQAS